MDKDLFQAFEEDDEIQEREKERVSFIKKKKKREADENNKSAENTNTTLGNKKQKIKYLYIYDLFYLIMFRDDSIKNDTVEDGMKDKKNTAGINELKKTSSMIIFY
jgi:hypothetical protein